MSATSPALRGIAGVIAGASLATAALAQASSSPESGRGRALPIEVELPGFDDEPLVAPAPGDRVRALELLGGAQRLAAYGAAEQALVPLRQALAADPACVEARLLHARLLLADGPLHDPLAGLREARLAALIAPGTPQPMAAEGLARFLLGDSGRARALLERCEALDEAALAPGLRAAVLEALAFLDLRRDDVEAAAPRMEESARLRPQRGFTRYGLAQLAGARGDLAAKLVHLDDAVRLDAQLLVAWHERAQLLRRLRRDEEAARSRKVAELLRELQDDTSARFADDHAGRAARWLELARLADDPRHWLERWRALDQLREHARIGAEGSEWIAAKAPRADVVIATARAYARAGDELAARETAARLPECLPPPPPELAAALAREVEALLRDVRARKRP